MRSLHGVNERFETDFNAASSSAVVNQRFSKLVNNPKVVFHEFFEPIRPDS